MIQEMEASKRNGAEGEEERRIFLRRMGYETGKDTGTGINDDKRHHHHYRYRYVIRAQLLELLLLSCVGVQNAILHDMHVFKGNIFVCS